MALDKIFIKEFLKKNYPLSIMCINHQFLEFYHVLRKLCLCISKSGRPRKSDKGTDALIRD